MHERLALKHNNINLAYKQIPIMNHTRNLHFNHLKSTLQIKKSDQALLIKSLNQVVFYMFLLFIFSVNFCCLYVFPYLIKTPLTIVE